MARSNTSPANASPSLPRISICPGCVASFGASDRSEKSLVPPPKSAISTRLRFSNALLVGIGGGDRFELEERIGNAGDLQRGSQPRQRQFVILLAARVSEMDRPADDDPARARARGSRGAGQQLLQDQADQRFERSLASADDRSGKTRIAEIGLERLNEAALVGRLEVMFDRAWAGVGGFGVAMLGPSAFEEENRSKRFGLALRLLGNRASRGGWPAAASATALLVVPKSRPRALLALMGIPASGPTFNLIKSAAIEWKCEHCALV